MKKLLLGLGVITTASSPIAVMMSCSKGNDKKEEKMENTESLVNHILSIGLFHMENDDLIDSLTKLKESSLLDAADDLFVGISDKIKSLDVNKVVNVMDIIKTTQISALSDTNITDIKDIVKIFMEPEDYDNFDKIFNFVLDGIKRGPKTVVNNEVELEKILTSFNVDMSTELTNLMNDVLFHGLEDADDGTSAIEILVSLIGAALTPVLLEEMNADTTNEIIVIIKQNIIEMLKPIDANEIKATYENLWTTTDHDFIDANDELAFQLRLNDNTGILTKQSHLNAFMETSEYTTKSDAEKAPYEANKILLDKEVDYYNNTLKSIVDEQIDADPFSLGDVPLLKGVGILVSTLEQMKANFHLIRDFIINFRNNKYHLIYAIKGLLSSQPDTLAPVLHILENDIFEKVIAIDFDKAATALFNFLDSGFQNLDASNIQSLLPIVNMVLTFNGEDNVHEFEVLTIPEIQSVLDLINNGIGTTIRSSESDIRSALKKILNVALNSSVKTIIPNVLFGEAK
ncbi:hypothetical protein [Candidatus Mycoplasma mahonii]|uniref:hypothetical protein n=1 Tax=Candidatus Mycoplasma mahonii TaxID=3004105 RepID=UPI0026E9C6C2|nr:hypothetical protein [Candidatus Mycoplasma mahonii]WKX02779.1 hypothetical protein O3I44_01755 [Candidatus Mycoplasma mahonii]